MSNIQRQIDNLILDRDNHHEEVARALKETLMHMFNSKAFTGFNLVPDPIDLEKTNDVWAESFEVIYNVQEDSDVQSMHNVYRIHASRNGYVAVGVLDDYSNRIATGSPIDLDSIETSFVLTNVYDKSVATAVVDILDNMASADAIFGEAYGDYIVSLPAPQASL